MQENNFINSALKVIQIEGKAILGLQDQIEETFNDLCVKHTSHEREANSYGNW